MRAAALRTTYDLPCARLPNTTLYLSLCLSTRYIRSSCGVAKQADDGSK